MITTTPRERGTHDTTPTDPHNEPTDGLLRPLALTTRDFADVLEYLGEWENEDGAAAPRSEVRCAPAGRMLGGNQVGPYCAITLTQLGGPNHRAIAARATDATLDALRPLVVTDNDTLHFQLVGHEQAGRVLVIVRHGKILGDHWLAYVEPDTLPPYPYAQRDERVEETCQSLRDSGHTPYMRRLEDGVIEVEPSERGTKIKTSIDAVGAVTRTWGNGRSIVEPPRDSDEAIRAAAQLDRHPPHRPQATSVGEANGRPASAPAQQTLFGDEPATPAVSDERAAAPSVNGTVPVRRQTVEDTAVAVLARADVTDDLVVLPDQLERGLYEKVNKALTALGGKWNRRRGGHVFPPNQLIANELAAIVNGGVLERMLTGYFPTPRPLAEQLIALTDVRPEHLVLEPSAGRGAIADLIAAIVPAERLYLVERDPTHHQALEQAGYRPPHLICDDFLTTTALPGSFDRIVMNPPFEQRQDVAHVLRAYELLAPGGRLAAITGAGVAFRTDKRTRALRELIEQSDGGSITENPPDAFKASGTSAHTLTLTLTKPPA
jgi:protein-L-isoaspartate O-methyltransferase